VIDIDKLVDGEWYDGFVYFSDKQRGVDSLRWDAESRTFFNDMMGVHYPRNDRDFNPFKTYEFEPNVLTVKTNQEHDRMLDEASDEYLRQKAKEE